MVDIDLLPQIYIPRQAISFDIERALWALSALAVLLIGLQVLQFRVTSAELSGLKTKVSEAEVRSKVLVLPREVKELQDRLDNSKKRLAGAENASTEVLARQLPWVALLRPISDLKPDGINLRSISEKEDGTIGVEGRAESEGAVVKYAGVLRLSNLFSDVTIQSLTTKDAIGFTMVLTLKKL